MSYSHLNQGESCKTASSNAPNPLPYVFQHPVRTHEPPYNQRRVEREKLREFAKILTDHRRLRDCGELVRIGTPGSLEEIIYQKARCGHRWLCPTCAYAAACRDATRLRHLQRGWLNQGGSLAFLTLTQRHSTAESLTNLWNRAEGGWSSVVGPSAYRSNKKTYGIRGYVRIAEVLHNPLSGWNVHYHVVFMLDKHLDQDSRTLLEKVLTDRWILEVQRDGGSANHRSQNLKMIGENGSAWVANYFIKGSTPYTTADGSRTPMEILARLHRSGEGISLWKEYITAVNTKRRTGFRPSKHIDALCQSPADYLDIPDFVRHTVPVQHRTDHPSASDARPTHAVGVPHRPQDTFPLKPAHGNRGGPHCRTLAANSYQPAIDGVRSGPASAPRNSPARL